MRTLLSISAAIVILSIPVLVFSGKAPNMADYCYLPPFVMDPNTPPNITIIYEKGSDILKRAYPITYNPNQTYYGFFDSNSYYKWNTSGKYFEKQLCTPSSADPGCLSGNLLNWALMSSLDLSRKALVGFGWPDPGAGTSAGEVFTYTGNFNGNKTPISYGQWLDGNSLCIGATVTIGGSPYTYSFKLSKSTGSNPTGVTIYGQSISTIPSCSGSSLVNNGIVAMKFTDENRVGIIQKYIDKDRDNKYDIDAPRFSIRRWNNGADKQSDIIAESTYTSDPGRNTLFKAILTAISKAPPDDPSTSYLGNMMKDIVVYYSGGSPTYADNDSTTQTPYNWSTDPAKKCRKTFTLFVTTGTYLGEDTNKLSPLPSQCTGLTYTDAFPTNTCYAYNTDLSTENGYQNIRTYILHTTFYGSGAANESKLRYAAYMGGGEYIKIDDPGQFETKLEEAILNILANASSASTVATLTTQTRGSSTLTQAYFYPRRTDNILLKWTGYLRLFWSDAGANLREDTENYAYLDEKRDRILTFILNESISPPQYVGRLYAIKDELLYPTNLNRGAYLKINSCNPTDPGNEDKLNESITAIWNAQNKIGIRPPVGLKETQPDSRMIKTAIGNPSGIADSTHFQDFQTTLKDTLKSFWSYDSFCSNNPQKWCFNNADCNYCTGTNRTCPGGTDSECNYCSLNIDIRCSSDTDCTIDYGLCQLPPGYSKYCTNNPSQACTTDSECSPFAICNTIAGTCQNNPAMVCTTDAECTGYCKGTCSGNPDRFCLSDTDCRDYYGSCETTVTCNTGFTCTSVCDSDCAESVIKYIRGYDKPTPKGGTFRIRHECKTSADCPSGTCDAGVCSGSDITNTLKLGDIVYSTPRISPDSAVNGYDTMYGDTTYTEFIENVIKDKMPIVIVGANDGMVHAFKVAKLKDISPPTTDDNGYQVSKFVNLGEDIPPDDLGKEVWTYVPYNAIPYLKWYCQDNYCHIPMVDARFTVVDASINGDPGAIKDQSSWSRLLIGAMGIGGKRIETADNRNLSSSIFVIDITNPENPRLLWESPLLDNTLTTANPAIIRFGEGDKNGSWFLVIGSGPQGVTTNRLEYKSGNAFLYVFDLKTGELKKFIDTGLSGYAIGDLMAVDLDSDYNVDDLYFGTYKGSGPTQTGQLYRFRIRTGETSYATDPAGWSSSMLSTILEVGRPIFASPEVAVDESNNIWIYFGTGLYLTMEHARATTDNEYIYAFIESKDCWMGTGTCSTYQPSDFYDTTSIQMTGAKATKIGCYCLSDPQTGSIVGTSLVEYDCTSMDCSTISCGSNQAMVVLDVKEATLTNGPPECNNLKDDEAIACMEDFIRNNYKGWRRTLTGKKVFSMPFVGGGLVDITAFQPTSDVCSLGGNTHLIALHYTTGTAFKKPAILMPTGTSGGINNLTINVSVDIGKGVPPLGESLVALALSGDAYAIITQVSGALPKTVLNPSIIHKSGYVLWLVK